MKWVVYIVLCENGSHYTGISTDPVRRMKEHTSSKRGAKFFRTTKPKEVIWTSEELSHVDALRLERKVKRMGRKKRLELLDKNKNKC